jgi:hypothetical protein
MNKCEKIPGPCAEIPFFGSLTVVLVHPDGKFKMYLQIIIRD